MPAPPGGRVPNPLGWVPTSYLAMGLVYVTVGSLANILLKNVGLSNEQAAFWSSLLGLPYIIKPLWAPLLELRRSKKFFVVLMQLVLAALVGGAGLALLLPGRAFVAPLLGLLALAAFAGATQDIGSDGLYVTTLDPRAQARLTGVQSMCWNLGPILAMGVLVRASGTLHERTGDWRAAWAIILGVIAALVGALAIWHAWRLPAGMPGPAGAGEAASAGGAHTFARAFATFFSKPQVGRMIAFAFFYRLGMGLLDKMGPLFMIDARARGGLGLSNQLLGDINGTFGTGAFIAGSALGGLFVARRGLRRALLPLCLCLNVPNLTFLYLSQALPQSRAVITAVVTVEKLGWGVGAVGHMIYMMQQIAPGPFKTAHYTFATAFMGLCMIATGMVSGGLQHALGYPTFFVVVLLAAIPSIAVTLLAPWPQGDVTAPQPAAAAAAPTSAAGGADGTGAGLELSR
ncbi:MAG TPA: MFS transporter [Polyangia bacterium]|nr:MFS transporter [Polyangia bacterium]